MENLKVINPQELLKRDITCCPNCGKVFTESLEVNNDKLGDHVICDECNSSFDI